MATFEPNPRRLVFSVTEVGHLRELLRVAHVFPQPQWEIVFLIYECLVKARFWDLCEERGYKWLPFDILTPVRFAAKTLVENQVPSTALQIATLVCQRGDPGMNPQELAQAIRWHVELHLERRCEGELLIDYCKPALLVVAEDCVEYPERTLVEAMRKRSLPSVLVPFTLHSNEEAAAAYCQDETRLVKNALQRLVARLYPRWVFQYQGQDLLRQPAEDIIVQEFLGLAPPIPWHNQSSRVNAIAADSIITAERMIGAGLPREQIIITGGAADHILSQQLANKIALREELYRSYGLPLNKPLALVSPLPSFPGFNQTEFKDHLDYMRFLAGCVTKLRQRFNVVAVQHPRLALRYFERFEAEGIPVVRGDTSQVLPLADLYVASLSSTIRWAIACGIPVVNYDVSRVDWPDYVGLSAVITVKSKASMESLIDRLATDPEYLSMLSQEQKKVAAKWGVVDGSMNANLQSLFTSLVERQPLPPGFCCQS